ncbi:FtsX-like permease family protein [Candidatus Azambacteria bacterium]|nr:FtsX-like permease family protein [Candidatus Azambacteria bacterium]
MIAILITFSTIKLTIYSFREDITVMRLVGATNWFIRGPFIIEGIIYGFLAALIALIVLYMGTEQVSGFLKGFLDNYNIFSYFKMNIVRIFGFLMITGVLLSTVSSLIAVRKYLKI